ncbi:hypothetical protein KGM_209623 [Danaus plexippus plexippus]|uniref:Uncharacterized protein n=1 Tax=Danaus plexippus plexippus TaxID=278856 RepID=A0A212F1M7_DANPL|nr:hypothetical protein KGM_209623 [Danaus plexippus plexippus]
MFSEHFLCEDRLMSSTISLTLRMKDFGKAPYIAERLHLAKLSIKSAYWAYTCFITNCKVQFLAIVRILDWRFWEKQSFDYTRIFNTWIPIESSDLGKVSEKILTDLPEIPLYFNKSFSRSKPRKFAAATCSSPASLISFRFKFKVLRPRLRFQKRFLDTRIKYSGIVIIEMSQHRTVGLRNIFAAYFPASSNTRFHLDCAASIVFEV